MKFRIAHFLAFLALFFLFRLSDAELLRRVGNEVTSNNQKELATSSGQNTRLAAKIQPAPQNGNAAGSPYYRGNGPFNPREPNA
mmetsp:Transcript_6286/g.7091  ORF Transcript_6286/g.7091 Transcript_6286/m.7091 type:complete len:84 (+) Transcript_6286:96-347(+)